MKRRKNILSAINLVVFLCSFTLTALSFFPSAPENQPIGHFQKQLIQSPHAPANNNLQLSEQNETESEDGFELTSIVLPFFFSQFQCEHISFSHSSAHLIADQASNAIYVAIHNFRI